MIGHASFRLRAHGRTLVTDPWWVGPLAPDSAGHFPPLVHDVRRLADETDFIYLSHIHPDHFHAETLSLVPRHVPVFIGAHRRKGFRDLIARLGFTVVECPFYEVVTIGDGAFNLAMLEHDYEENAAFDSSIVIRTPEFTVFNNNDCVLVPEKYDWVRERFRVDYAFLGFSPASFFPICFEMEEAEKRRLLHASAERRYRDFVAAAQRLRPALAVPFASGARFLLAGERWKNVAFNSAPEAVRRAAAAGLGAAVMGPGDRIDRSGTLIRRSPILNGADELAAIEIYASTMNRDDQLSPTAPMSPLAERELVARFRRYIAERWRETHAQLPGLSAWTIAYEVGSQRFHFDFSRPESEIFGYGLPERYDMLYRYPTVGLRRKLDGLIDWDDLHFSRGVSVHQVRYAKEFFALLRSEMLDWG